MIDTLSQPPPTFSAERARELASRLFGIDGQASPLVSERDQNFLVDTGKRRYVLKIANSAESSGVLELQNEALLHIAERAPDLPVPRVCRSRDREDIVCIRDSDGAEYAVRLITFLPGKVLAECDHAPALMLELGELMGGLVRALDDFEHVHAQRELLWNLHGAERMATYVDSIGDTVLRARVNDFIARYASRTAPLLCTLPAQVIHNDGNDHNVLVDADGHISGLVDFGDMLHAARVCELAVTLAYAMMNKHDPLAVARSVVAGFNSVVPLQDEELAALYDLVGMRLCLTLCIAAWRHRDFPDNDYLLVSQRGAHELFEHWTQLYPEIVEAAFRAACDRAPVADSPGIVDWLAKRDAYAPVLGNDLEAAPKLVVEFAEHSADWQSMHECSSAAEFDAWLQRRLQTGNARVAVGLYGEDRPVYTTEQFGNGESKGEWRSVHLGVDLFAPADTPVQSPLPGTVNSVQNNSARLDYGPTVIVRHQCDDGTAFYTLYGHLSLATLEQVRAGQQLDAGEVLGWIGTWPHNGDWAPHLHFQLISLLLDRSGNFPGAAAPSHFDLWRHVCPDPNLILRIPDALLAPTRPGQPC